MQSSCMCVCVCVVCMNYGSVRYNTRDSSVTVSRVRDLNSNLIDNTFPGTEHCTVSGTELCAFPSTCIGTELC